MSYTNKLIKAARMLSDIGEKELSSDILCALAAVNSGIMPRADLTYSSIMRELRKNKDYDVVKDFQKEFKKAFEDALDNQLDNPEQIAIMHVLQNMELEL